MKLECHIVKDLLPNYIDNLTSPKTSNDIKQHLESCNHCNSDYLKMKNPTIDKIPEKNQNLNELNYLNKFNKKYSFLKKLAIGLFILSTVLFMSFIIISLKAYHLQYNDSLTSNYLTISINDSKGIEYIGTFEDKKIYTYMLEEAYFSNFFAKHVNLKEALENNSISIKDMTKHLSLVDSNDMKIYKFENYQIIILNNICVISPLSEIPENLIDKINSVSE